jgi:dimethylargininase
VPAPPIALVRAVPATFPECIVGGPQRPSLDVETARSQHAAYRATLAAYGYEVHCLPADDRFPDSVFVEDTVVVVGPTALLTRPGAASRRGEVDAVAPFIAGHMAVRTLEAPATLDGGDVLHIGDRIFVGRSARTNDAGIAAVRDLAAAAGIEVVAVDVERVLHLKTAVNALDDTTVIAAEGAIGLGAFGAYGLVTLPAAEAPAANVLRLDEHRVLMPGGYPEARRRAEAAGVGVVVTDVSQFVAADGGVTCMSVLLPAASRP